MKKYIQPMLYIEFLSAETSFLVGNQSRPESDQGSGDVFSNQALYDDLEDAYPTKGNDLWDDAYQNDGI